MIQPGRAAGAVVAGCELVAPLARGGMGEVWRARRQADGHAVAVKLLAPECAFDVALRQRFVREADALRRVPPHPHLVRVLDVVREGPEPAIVLELIDGAPLSSVVARQGRLGWRDAARVGREAALGLAALHAQGVVHRDLKPDNVLVTRAGAVRLVDLGVAKDAQRSALTAPGELLGTLPYMAPEQWRGEAVDARTDLFALGATLYLALTGERAFPGDDPAELAARIADGEVEPLVERAPDAPPELVALVERLLAPGPRDRPSRADAVAIDLGAVLAGAPGALVPRLDAADGSRLLLGRGRASVIGAGPGATLVVAGPGIAPRHAELRRRGDGFAAVDLRSPGGTFVGSARVTSPRALAHGDVLRLGPAVTLRFHDPDAEEAWLAAAADAPRASAPAPLVEALVRRADPRAWACLAERATPDPRVAEQALAALGAAESAAAQSLRERALQLGLADARAAEAALTSGVGGSPPAAGWAPWWDAARLAAPAQVVDDEPPCLRLVVTRSDVAADVGRSVELTGARLPLLVGRDPRAGLRLASTTVSPLHVTIGRAARRLVARNEDAGLGTLLDGAPLEVAFVGSTSRLALGAIELTVEAPAAPPRLVRPARLPPLAVIDAITWRALEGDATLAALALLLDAPRAWGPLVDDAARALGLDASFVSAAHALLVERARAARARLVQALGADRGDDPAAWAAALAERAATTPQLAPAGWHPLLA